jgi:hypothetical protein
MRDWIQSDIGKFPVPKAIYTLANSFTNDPHKDHALDNPDELLIHKL